MSNESSITLSARKAVEAVIFNIRWILPFFYVGLVIVMLMYGYTYVREIVDLFSKIRSVHSEDMELIALNFVDVVMIANLIKMIITGSYNSFIAKDHGYKNETITSSGILKIKITTSIIVVCSINLLKTFVNPEIPWDTLVKQLLIYVVFLCSTFVLGLLEYLHVKSEVMEKSVENHHASQN